jgi:hypothetical protein
MTYKILTDDTHRIIHRSNIHSAADPNARNLRLDPLNDEPPEVIQSLRKASPALDHGEDSSLHSMEPTDENPERPSTGDDMVIVDPQELLGCTFPMDTQEDGQRFCARIIECISDHEFNVCHSDDHVKFRIPVNEEEYEEIITYNELMDLLRRIKKMTQLCGDSNVSWVIKVLSYSMTRTTMVQGSMCWLNGRMGRLGLNLSRSLQPMSL